jgi:hypothetical protein
MPPPAEFVATRGVLAGAYRGKDIEARALLHHAVDTRTETSLCKRIGPESICDEPLGGPELVTCPLCRERDPRR